MSGQPPEIEKLLIELRSEEAYRRKAAAEEVAALGLKDEQIITALETVAAQDPNRYVKSAAEAALIALGVKVPEKPPAAPKIVPPPLSTAAKRREFMIGFVGWWVVNGALWLGLTGGEGLGPGGFGIILNLLLFPANLLMLIVLAFIRRWIALGGLAAIAVNLLIALIMGVALAGFCFIPFFTPGLQ